MSGRVDIPANLERVQERMRGAARRAGRAAGEVTLVAVTKTHSLQAVQAAYQAGVRHFGENRVEEGLLKIPAFNEWLAVSSQATAPPTWHMIGHLQSRKAADALAHFDVIHSVDSLKLAQRLNRLAERDPAGTLRPILLQSNVSGEASKYGFGLSRWQEERETRRAFFDTLGRIIQLPRLRIQGLMTMAPMAPHAEQARPIFAALRALRDELAQEFPAVEWRHLSMGMTDDFEVAIEEGATLIRVGRAIFGPR
ncbi:MAG: YggS family pyridoxal phosphate-dependent enzyme [Anaerolineales bacterium]|nr:MAG: YggS family pyridoxal phosphate-dependent enzyme [Anaerolineales bacterium]